MVVKRIWKFSPACSTGACAVNWKSSGSGEGTMDRMNAFYSITLRFR